VVFSLFRNDEKNLLTTHFTPSSASTQEAAHILSEKVASLAENEHITDEEDSGLTVENLTEASRDFTRTEHEPDNVAEGLLRVDRDLTNQEDSPRTDGEEPAALHQIFAQPNRNSASEPNGDSASEPNGNSASEAHGDSASEPNFDSASEADNTNVHDLGSKDGAGSYGRDSTEDETLSEGSDEAVGGMMQLSSSGTNSLAPEARGDSGASTSDLISPSIEVISPRCDLKK
jgi:hypothetical protein